ncbi:MAG: lysophospholipid acyltransferase family protein [Terriglobia bacterium]
MKKLYLLIRCVILWIVSILHFFSVCSFLVLLGIFVDPRKNDRAQRIFFRNILRVAGVGFEVRYAPGFDRTRTSVFICNHINLFDAFVIYSAIPQFVRGWELESHFKIPAYGWMMKRFGNIPISNLNSPAEYKKLLQRTKTALDDGISLIVFPEASRTLDGRVRPFQKGIFSMVQQLHYPMVPMSLVGSFEFNRKGSWMLSPAKIVVHLHDTIETQGLRKDEIDALQERVHRIVSKPVHEALGTRTES